MSTAVEQIVHSFEALSENQKQEAVVEILNRLRVSSSCELDEDAFVAAADEIFLILDKQEACDAKA